MNVEFFIHGVPTGEDFWGKEEERAFFGTFYDGSKDKLKVVIQARAVGGKQYFYYSYLVYDAVVANDGRDGSYFGMTLRLDEFCNDFMNMYRILDTVYNSYVVGKLLINDKSKLKYSVPKFSSFNMNGIYDKVKMLLQDTLSNDSFSRIDNTPVSGNQYRLWNLYDCTNESVLSEIRQYGKIALSPYYQSVKESSMQQQCESRIRTIQQQCQTQISESVSAYAQKEQTANATIRELQGQNVQLNTTLKQRNTEVNRLQQNVNELNNTLNQERQNKNIAKLIEQIKEPVKSLAEILDERQYKYGGTHECKSKKPFDDDNEDTNLLKLHSKRYVIGGVLAIIVVLVLVFMRPWGKKEAHNDHESAQTEMAEPRPSESEAAHATNNKVEENEPEESTAPENPFPVSSDFDITQVKIDIKDFNGGSLKFGTTYVVRALKGADNGSWKVEGAAMTETEDKNTIKISPSDEKITITYTVDGKEKSRTLTATE